MEKMPRQKLLFCLDNKKRQEMKPVSIIQLAEKILHQEGRPLHYKDLTDMLMSEIKLGGRTPHETVRARMGSSPKFKRVAEGVYALSEWQQYPLARFAKDIAYEIIQSRGKPIDLIELGQEVLTERYFVGGPSQTARNATKDRQRFWYDKETNRVGLVEWKR